MRPWLLSLCVLPVCAQTAVRLTLEEAIATALRQNPAVAIARQAVDQAAARTRQARADYYPQLGFNGIAKAGLSGGTNELRLVGLPNSPFYRNFADSLNASYRALDFGRTSHAVRAARLRHEAAEANLATVEASVILVAESAFYGLLRARELRHVAVETVRAREQTVRQAQALYEGKIRSRIDLDLSRVSLSQAQLALIEVENAVRRSAAELGRALGGSQEAAYELEAPDLTLPELEPLPKLIEEALERRPELRSLRAERAAAAESVSQARSQRWPLLSFVFSGGYARFTNVLARQLLAGGAGLAMPVFTGGSLGGQSEEAEARVRILDSRIEEAMQQVAFETRTAHLRLQNSLESIPTQKLRVDYAREAVRLARARYSERLGTIVELTQSEVALAEAEAAAVAGVYQAKIAHAELRLAIARR